MTDYDIVDTFKKNHIDLDDILDSVKYDFKGYVPKKASIEFVEFRKLIRGKTENVTPLVHYKILDNIFSKSSLDDTVLAHRGLAKTTIAEELFWYIATFGRISNFGDTNLSLYVSDSIDNGVKTMKQSMDLSYEDSTFLQNMLPKRIITDIEEDVKKGYYSVQKEIAFVNAKKEKSWLKMFGAQTGVRGPLALDELLYTDTGSKTMRDIEVGDYVFIPNGKSSKVVGKSKIFNDEMYELEFNDGRKLKVNHSHLNPIYIYKKKSTIEKSYIKHLVTTDELYKLFNSGKKLITKINEPIKYSEKSLPLSPYLLGIALGDGNMPYSKGLKISGLEEHCEFYYEKLKDEYNITKTYFKERSGTKMLRLSVHGITDILRKLNIAGITGSDKFIPQEYMFGSENQRKDLLAGLLDTDGACNVNKKNQSSSISFSNTSKALADGVADLVRSLGGKAKTYTKKRKVPRKTLYEVNIVCSSILFYLPEKANKVTPNKYEMSKYIKLINIKKIGVGKSQCIMIEDKEHEFLTTNYLTTHNTKIGQYRPEFAIFDDLIQKEEHARSQPTIESIESTVYSDVEDALHPGHRKIIWFGTPFNQNDPLYKAVVSDGWRRSVYPVCEKFPCKKEEFVGSWGERFTYEAVMATYRKRKSAGKTPLFYREMMLRVSPMEDRIVKDDDIVWFSRDRVLENKYNYNFYITTDFATSEKDSSDPSGIFVWAINNKGYKMLVDGIMKRQLMRNNIDDLFRFIKIYNPDEVGVEISGQQAGFVDWIEDEMTRRNIYFRLAGKDNKGIRPTKNKFERFMLIQPQFSLKRIWFAKELINTDLLQDTLNQLKKITVSGIGTIHDEAIDCISMLNELQIIEPSETSEMVYKNGVFEEDTYEDFTTKNNLIL